MKRRLEMLEEINEYSSIDSDGNRNKRTNSRLEELIQIKRDEEKEAKKNVSDQTKDVSLGNSLEEKVAPVKKRKRPVKAPAEKENLTKNDVGASEPVLETSKAEKIKEGKKRGWWSRA